MLKILILLVLLFKLVVVANNINIVIRTKMYFINPIFGIPL